MKPCSPKKNLDFNAIDTRNQLEPIVESSLASENPKACHGIAYHRNQTEIHFIFHFIQSLNKKECRIYRLYTDGAIEKNNVVFPLEDSLIFGYQKVRGCRPCS